MNAPWFSGAPKINSSKMTSHSIFTGQPFTRLSGPIHRQTEVRLGRSASIVFPETPNDLELTEEIDAAIYQNMLPVGRSMAQVKILKCMYKKDFIYFKIISSRGK